MKDRIQTIAEELGYPELNELQKLVFESPETYPDETGNTRNLMIIGPTSSGKTLIPKLLYYDAVLEALEKGMPTPKMLFVVPYRALAAQKVSELRIMKNMCCNASKAPVSIVRRTTRSKTLETILISRSS